MQKAGARVLNDCPYDFAWFCKPLGVASKFRGDCAGLCEEHSPDVPTRESWRNGSMRRNS